VSDVNRFGYAATVSPTAQVPRDVRVQGRRLETVEIEGDAGRRALVLLHEGLGSVGLWREFPRALAAATGRRVIAFSRYGHGRSEPPPAARTPAFFHEEASAERMGAIDSARAGWTSS
jgi:pimeloyl-ACP methyl ester carboxylesterase